MFGNQQAMDYAAINQQMGLPVAIGASLQGVTISQDDTYISAVPTSAPINRCNYRTQYAFGDIASNRIPVNGEYIKVVQVVVTVRAFPKRQMEHDLFLQVKLNKAGGSIITKRMSTQVVGCLSVNFTALCEKGSYLTVEVYGKTGDRFDNGEISVIGWPVQ